jgi:flagellar biosynthesis protein FlhF
MMETREFWGRDMSEALHAVRASLGADALILKTFSVPGENELEGQERIKVTAMGSSEEAPRPNPSAVTNDKRPLNAPGNGGVQRQPVAGGIVREGMEARGWRVLNSQLDDLKAMFCWLVPGMKHSRALNELLAHDVPPELLSHLVQQTDGSMGDERVLLRRALSQLLLTGGDVEKVAPGKCTRLAFIGPPGVGKTSALVKLTVHLMRKKDRKVGWVSLDNRRVTGVEELTVYARILGTPCEVAEGAEGLTRALERLSACDLVLIDTPGVSPRDAAELSELASVLQEQSESDVRRTLVLDAATNWRDAAVWAQRFQRVGYDSLLFSMIDECGCFGSLVNTVITSGAPLSYLTTGAAVTQGIEVAQPESIVDLLLP